MLQKNATIEETVSDDEAHSDIDEEFRGKEDDNINTLPVNGVDGEKESFLEQLELDLDLHEPVN